MDHEQHAGRNRHPPPRAPQARPRHRREDRPVPRLAGIQGLHLPYVPVWVEAMVKAAGLNQRGCSELVDPHGLRVQAITVGDVARLIACLVTLC